MCLYPRIIRNKKYLPNRKNEGSPARARDARTQAVAIGCGVCSECRKQKASSWLARIDFEMKKDPNAIFTTLTFSDETISKYAKRNDENAICAKEVELFRKRFYAKYKKPARHWLISEIGKNGTERVHMHGIFWKCTADQIRSTWNAGISYCGSDGMGNAIATAGAAQYCVKYVFKVNEKRPEFIGQIFASKGIGSGYEKSFNARKNEFKNEETKEFIKISDGRKTSMPMYWRNKMYTEEEREMLWINRLNKNTRYVKGEKIDISTKQGIQQYIEAVEQARKEDIRNGYGKIKWDKKKYLNKIEEIVGNIDKSNNFEKKT